jgi:hypothetical protein
MESRLVIPVLFSLFQYPDSGYLVTIRSKSDSAGPEDTPGFTCNCQQANQFQAVHRKLSKICSQHMPKGRTRYRMQISGKRLAPAPGKSALYY